MCTHVGRPTFRITFSSNKAGVKDALTHVQPPEDENPISHTTSQKVLYALPPSITSCALPPFNIRHRPLISMPRPENKIHERNQQHSNENRRRPVEPLSCDGCLHLHQLCKRAPDELTCCGQHAQKKAHSEYTTAKALIGTPHRPRENSAGGRVEGSIMRRHRTQPMERQ